MGAFVTRRILVNTLVFVVISIGVFLLVRAAPGDPVRMMIKPEDLQGGSEAFIQAKKEELGLDHSVLVQYARWFRDAVTGDLGTSFVSNQPVTALLFERLGPTVLLMSSALGLGVGDRGAAGHRGRTAAEHRHRLRRGCPEPGYDLGASRSSSVSARSTSSRYSWGGFRRRACRRPMAAAEPTSFSTWSCRRRSSGWRAPVR